MKKFILATLFLLNFAPSLYAEDWAFLKDTPKTAPQYGVAIIAGSSDLDKYHNSGDIYGLELSFDCQYAKASEHTIRQQLSLTKFNKGSLDMYTLEANPHYMYQLESNTYFGIGPSLGLAYADGDSLDHFLVTMGLGASLKKDITEELFLDLEARTVYATERDADNFRVVAKVGYYYHNLFDGKTVRDLF